MPAHPFDEAIALTRIDDDCFAGHTSEAYWNSISPYGGITVAAVLNALLLHPRRLGDPLAMTINFAGAIKKGPFSIRVHPARTGRSTQHWLIELRQDGDAEPLITGTAVFATARETWSDIEAAMPPVPQAADLAAAPALRTIPFLERYAMRYVDCNPFAGGESSLTQCWLSDVPLRKIDFPSLAAFCDSFIPRLFVRKGAPRPVATVTLGINFHVDGPALEAEQGMHVFTRARANAFNRGYYDQEALVWSESGKLLATTQQMVWYRE
ncbi:MAG TPA: thioesterase family protein [Noviherbaspirillum sp.]|nr:thioesterase family protein [Noviherbaspirillum sp.]